MGEFLDKYTRDLTEDAKEGRLDPVIGRDDEVQRTVQVKIIFDEKILLEKNI